MRGEGRRRQKQHRRAATPAELPPARRDFAAPQRRPPARGAAQEAEADGKAGERCLAAVRRPPGTVTMVCHPRRGAPGPAPRGAQLLLGPTRRPRPLPCHSTPPARGQDRRFWILCSAPPHWSAWSPAPPPPLGPSLWGDLRPGCHDNRCLGSSSSLFFWLNPALGSMAPGQSSAVCILHCADLRMKPRGLPKLQTQNFPRRARESDRREAAGPSPSSQPRSQILSARPGQ